jgi:hypothetical protein
LEALERTKVKKESKSGKLFFPNRQNFGKFQKIFPIFLIFHQHEGAHKYKHAQNVKTQDAASN